MAIPENRVPQTKADLEESHPYWEFVIRVLFYKQPGGAYRTWCFVGDSVTRDHFPIAGEFATVDEARTAAVTAGRKRIEQGFKSGGTGRAAEGS